jgi:hypothetical protein
MKKHLTSDGTDEASDCYIKISNECLISNLLILIEKCRTRVSVGHRQKNNLHHYIRNAERRSVRSKVFTAVIKTASVPCCRVFISLKVFDQ